LGGGRGTGPGDDCVSVGLSFREDIFIDLNVVLSRLFRIWEAKGTDGVNVNFLVDGGRGTFYII
jgi:hypothetical protein